MHAVGGVMGYKKKRSKDSLIASSIIAGLLLFSAYLMGKPNTTYGVRLAMGMSPHSSPRWSKLAVKLVQTFLYTFCFIYVWMQAFHDACMHSLYACLSRTYIFSNLSQESAHVLIPGMPIASAETSFHMYHGAAHDSWLCFSPSCNTGDCSDNWDSGSVHGQGLL